MSSFHDGKRLTGLGPVEATIWKNYLEQFGGNYFDYKYNVRLDKPINLPDEMHDTYKNMAYKIAALRIDVVAESRDHIMIFENRPSARANAIGNLICYRFLYLMQFSPTKPVKMALLTDNYDPLIEITTRAAGIGYMVF